MKYKKILLIPMMILSSLTSCGSKPSSSSDGGSITSPNGGSITSPSGIVCGENTGTPLSSVTSSNLGSSFDGTVIVAGVRGNDLYVEDSTGAAYVYSKTATNAKVGDQIKLTGTIGEFTQAKIVQITNPIVTVVGSSCRLKQPVKTTLANLNNYRFSRVSVDNITIKSLNIIAGNSKDSSAIINDGTADSTLFIKKTLSDKSAIEQMLNTVGVGGKISVNGGFADFYSTSAQIALTSASQLLLPEMTVEQKLNLVADKLNSDLNGSRLRKNISLPTSGDYGSKITWKSSNTKVISNTGVVTRPTDADKVVTLNYTITISGQTKTGSVSVTVLKYVEGEAEYEFTYVEPNYNGTYYNTIDDEARSSELLMDLYTLLAKTSMPSNFSYSYLWNVFPDTDGVPGRSGYYYAFYTGKETARSAMNKEHVWPKSRGSDRSCEKDPHMVRPALSADNSGRGNDFYNVGSNYDPGSLGNNNYRGIAARIIFYCAVKYQNEGLNLVDKNTDSTANKSMGKLSTLLKWNLEYDIDKTEIQRNEALYTKYKWVRNPFIDDRNYACKIWGDTNAETQKVCGKVR